MSKLVASDVLWTLIARRPPAARPKSKGGRPRIADRATLTGILFVLKLGNLWEMLP